MDVTFPITRLEIGAGERPTPGYVHLDARSLPDIEIIAAVPPIPLPDDSVKEEIYTSHFVEHVPKWRVAALFKEFFRILCPGGRLHVCVPNIQRQAQDYVSGAISDETFEWLIYGGRDYDVLPQLNQHYCGYTPNLLKRRFLEAGFSNVIHLDPRPGDPADWLRMEGEKPTHTG